MTQKELREKLRDELADTLDSLGMPDLSDACYQSRMGSNPDWLDKASYEVYADLDKALNRISRLAKRLDYLENDTTTNN